jgi:hypothetical protein
MPAVTSSLEKNDAIDNAALLCSGKTRLIFSRFWPFAFSAKTGDGHFKISVDASCQSATKNIQLLFS